MKAPKRQRGRPPAKKRSAPGCGPEAPGGAGLDSADSSSEQLNSSSLATEDETADDPPLLVVELVVDPLDLLLPPRQQQSLDRLLAALSDPRVDIAEQLAEEIDRRLQTAARIALFDLLSFDPERDRRQRLLDERRVIPFSEFNNRRIARLAASSDSGDGSDDEGGGA